MLRETVQLLNSELAQVNKEDIALVECRHCIHPYINTKNEHHIRFIRYSRASTREFKTTRWSPHSKQC